MNPMRKISSWLLPLFALAFLFHSSIWHTEAIGQVDAANFCSHHEHQEDARFNLLVTHHQHHGNEEACDGCDHHNWLLNFQKVHLQPAVLSLNPVFALQDTETCEQITCWKTEFTYQSPPLQGIFMRGPPSLNG